jgi:hypothetical protein
MHGYYLPEVPVNDSAQNEGAFHKQPRGSPASAYQQSAAFPITIFRKQPLSGRQLPMRQHVPGGDDGLRPKPYR